MIRAIGILLVTVALLAPAGKSFARGVHFGVPRFCFVPRTFTDRHVLFGKSVTAPPVADEPYPIYSVYPSALDGGPGPQDAGSAAGSATLAWAFNWI